MPVTVWLQENSRHADDEGRYPLGEFDTVEAAIAECRRIVDEFLQSQRTSDITANELFRIYSLFGEEPYLVGEGADFSAWDYAKRRCEDLCES
jgi:hypothetical protein